MIEIKGIIPAMVTPFDENEELNEQALRRLTNYLIEGGVHGLFATGSQGEFFALTPEEKRKVWQIVVEETKGRVPIYAGTGAITTREVIELNKMAEEVGVDAVSIITPYFISPTQDELYEHYAAIAKETKLPIILYGNPARTGGLGLSVGLVRRLAGIENICGIKDSTGDLSLTAEYIRQVRGETPDFACLMGRDTLIYGALEYGAQGAIAATGNVCPKVVAEIYDAFVAGDEERARAAQYRLAPLRIAFGFGTFPVVVKEALKLVGIDAGPCRRPVGPMPEAKREELERIVESLGVLGAAA